MGELLKVSIIYFNYEKSIRIDAKSNSDDNNLFINIITDIFIDDLQVLQKYLKILPQNCIETIQLHNKWHGDCSTKEEKIFQQNHFMECLSIDGISVKKMFSEEQLQEYTNDFQYHAQIGRELNLSDSKHFTYAYTFHQGEPIVKCSFFLNLVTSINMSHIQITPRSKRNEFFRLKILKNSLVSNRRHTYIYLSHENPLHSYDIPGIYSEISDVNQTIIVQKLFHKFLKPPHGNCSDYLDNSELFFANNQWQCYRRCLKNKGRKELGCNPLFIEYTIHELDFTASDLQINCNSSLQQKFDKYVDENDLKTKCEKFCPKDCQRIDFKMKTIRNSSNYETDRQSTHYTKSLVWDSTQPMFVYYEEPIMSFIEYLVHCGGLVGLWFGTSAQDVIRLFLKLRIWSYFWGKLKNQTLVQNFT